MVKQYTHRHRELYRGVNIDIKASSSKELQEKVNKRKSQIDRGTIDENTLLRDFGERFLSTHKLHTVSASWYRDLQYNLESIIRGIGNRPLSHIRPMDLQQYLNSLASMSESTVKKRFDLLCQIFRDAYHNGAIPTDYTIGLTKPSGRSTVTGRSITDKERSVLLQVLDGHRGELFCKIILYCGLRPSEVQALQWKDIDLKNNTIEITKAMKPDGSIGTPKTSSAYRTVPIPLHFASLLKSHKGQPFDYLFSHGQSWRRRMWQNVQREMNITMGCRTFRNKLIPPYPLADDFTMYNLRHTYCTDLEKAGVPINIASRLMGHSNISITSKIYTHASVEAMEIARNLIDRKDVNGKCDGKEIV